MKPRTSIVSVVSAATYREVLELSERTRLSRFPVRESSSGIDNVLGILYVKDMLAFKTHPRDFSVKKIMREPVFIPGTKKLSSAQAALREKKQSLAVVVDEYSGTAGLLSIEDIAAEIFGAMTDEYDANPSRADEIRQIREGEFLCDASVRLTEVAEKTGVALESPFYETLGGFVLEKLDRIPRPGDSVTLPSAALTVVDATDRLVKSIRVKKKE
jgi:CBS domain containing-hemolysin-like protein